MSAATSHKKSFGGHGQPPPRLTSGNGQVNPRSTLDPSQRMSMKTAAPPRLSLAPSARQSMAP